jgi:SOS response regulatory protein OraA/RecX
MARPTRVRRVRHRAQTAMTAYRQASSMCSSAKTRGYQKCWQRDVRMTIARFLLNKGYHSSLYQTADSHLLEPTVNVTAANTSDPARLHSVY